MELCLLTVPRRAPRFEQAFLGRDQLRDLGLALARRQLRLGRNRGPAIALRLQPSAARGELVELLGNDLQIGPRHRIVETDQQLILLDLVAVADLQLADDASGRVLDLLDVAVDDKLAGRDHGARPCRRDGPDPDRAGE
ncbi:hypothetical protein D3C87_1678060 [compost metagenome]